MPAVLRPGAASQVGPYILSVETYPLICHKIHSLKLHNSVACRLSIKLSNNYCYLIPDTFIIHKETLFPLDVTPEALLSLPALETANLPALYGLLCLSLHINEIRYVAICAKILFELALHFEGLWLEWLASVLRGFYGCTLLHSVGRPFICWSIHPLMGISVVWTVCL